jgi:hypothetical protein
MGGKKKTWTNSVSRGLPIYSRKITQVPTSTLLGKFLRYSRSNIRSVARVCLSVAVKAVYCLYQGSVIAAPRFNDRWTCLRVMQLAPRSARNIQRYRRLFIWIPDTEAWNWKAVVAVVHAIRLEVQTTARWFTGKTEQVATPLADTWLSASAASRMSGLSADCRNRQMATLVW